MTIHRNFVALIVAVSYALLVLLTNFFTQAPEAWLRASLTIALYLISRDSLATADLAKGPRSITNPARWIFAFYLGLYFGAFMLLIFWRGMEGLPGLLGAILVGSLLYGGLMAFLIADKPYRFSHHYETEKPMLLGKAGLFLYYIAPALKLAAIWILVKYSPHSTTYLFFYTILIGFAFPRYARKTDGQFLWANSPTLVGYLFLGLPMIVALS